LVAKDMNQVVMLIPSDEPADTIARSWMTLLDADMGVHMGWKKKKIDLLNSSWSQECSLFPLTASIVRRAGGKIPRRNPAVTRKYAAAHFTVSELSICL